MRKSIVFAAACLMFACSFLLIVQPAGAAIAASVPYSGAWLPNDTDVPVFSVNLDIDIDGTGIFGFYDWGEDYTVEANTLEIVSSSSFITSTTINFQWNAGGYYEMGNTELGYINLGSTQEFGLYFYDTDYITEYTYEKISDDMYDIVSTEFFDSLTVRMHDATPVPIPTAALLLGSGLVGLVGFRRKRQTS